jgi:hypothetical protein
MATRILRFSALALAALVGGACGSAADHASVGSPAPKRLAKLSLTKGSAAGAADAVAPMPLRIRPTSYVLDGTLPDLGATAPVYRWTAQTATLADVNRIAGALGIDADASTTPDGFQATDGTHTLIVSVNNGSTQVSYYPSAPGAVSGGSSGSSSGSSGSADATPPPDKPAEPAYPAQPAYPAEPPTTLPSRLAPVAVPSAHDAETIAHDLLDRAGVLGDSQWTTAVNDSGGIAVSCAVGQSCTGVPDEVTARDVTFTLSIDGVRVEGINWNVTIGEHSRIESVYGEWGSPTVLGSYALRSTAAAFDALQHGDTSTGGIEAVDGDVPVQAQDSPATGAPATGATSGDTTVPLPTVTEPAVADPVVVHITGAALGLTRWDAIDGNENVIDLVPTYAFHTALRDGSAADSASDISELALDPAAIDFADPIVHPTPMPVPEPGVTTEPAPPPKPSAGDLSSPR